MCNCGGILALKEIAAMAEPWHVAVAPHNYNSTTVGLASTLQVSACIPNFLITEYFVNFEAVGREIARPRLRGRRTATSRCPPRPAWASSSTKAALARYPLRDRQARAIRQFGDE